MNETDALKEMKLFCEKMAIAVSALQNGKRAIDDLKNLEPQRAKLVDEISALRKQKEEISKLIDEEKKEKYAEIAQRDADSIKKQSDLDELLRINKNKAVEYEVLKKETQAAQSYVIETQKKYDAKLFELNEKERNVKAAFQTING